MIPVSSTFKSKPPDHDIGLIGSLDADGRGLLMVAAVGIGSHGPTLIAATSALVAVTAAILFRPVATLAVLLTVAVIVLSGPPATATTRLAAFTSSSVMPMTRSFNGVITGAPRASKKRKPMSPTAPWAASSSSSLRVIVRIDSTDSG